MADNDSHKKPKPPERATVSARISADRKSAILRLLSERGSVGIRLELPELEDFIQNVAKVRALLEEAVPVSVDPGSRVHVVLSPLWTVSANSGIERSPGILVSLRHPGFGWLSFVLARPDARRFGEAIAAFSQRETE
jgi:hypothetical protein